MSDRRVSKLNYDTIRRVVKTTPMHVTVEPRVDPKLSEPLISRLIHHSPFFSSSSKPGIAPQDSITKGVKVIKSLAQINSEESGKPQPRSDESSITVLLE